MTKPPVDVNEAGRVLAQLDDVRAIFFVLFLVIVVLIIDRALDRRANRLAANALTTGLDKLAASIDKMTEAQSTKDMAMIVHNARVESVLGRVENHLQRAEVEAAQRHEAGDAR